MAARARKKRAKPAKPADVDSATTDDARNPNAPRNGEAHITIRNANGGLVLHQRFAVDDVTVAQAHAEAIGDPI